MEQSSCKLRKGIDCIGNTVVFFCHDGRGNHIMAKRSQNARDEQGKWDIGGGGIEKNETVLQTVIQEIKQEYCVEVLDIEFLGYRDVHRVLPDGTKTHWIALDFKVLVNPQGMAIGEPHKFDDISWFTLENMPQEVHSQFPEFLRLYQHRL